MGEKFYPITVLALSDEDGGGFVAYAADLYGCMADGDTPEEAFENIKAAVAEWCDEAKQLGREIPEPGSAAKAYRKGVCELLEFIKQQGDDLNELRAQLDNLEKQLASFAHLAGERDERGDCDFWSVPISPLGPRVLAPDYH